jgi:DNA polymerase V
MLVKLHHSKSLEIYSANTESELMIPFAKQGISAGFPSPAEDFLDISIDLNKELIKNPSATFYGRVKGNSMIEAGLSDGDLLIIDKSLEPKNGKIAVCFIDGEFTVKRIKISRDNGIVWLVAENKDYKPIRVTPENELMIWGIVTTVIKKM